MKAYELLCTEKNLCRGNFAVDKDSINATYTNPGINPDTGTCKAIKWDLQGALIYCYEYGEARRLTEKAKVLLVERNKQNESIGRGKSYSSLAEFNDMAPYAEIVSFLKKLEEENV